MCMQGYEAGMSTIAGSSMQVHPTGQVAPLCRARMTTILTAFETCLQTGLARLGPHAHKVCPIVLIATNP